MRPLAARTRGGTPLPSDAPGQPVLECQNLTKQYHHRPAHGVRPAVLDVSISLARGECLGILGESGSGKTTLVRCLSMLERPTAGSVRLAGGEFSSSSRTLTPR
jgi:ABC-type glutathione transport system ATPase component